MVAVSPYSCASLRLCASAIIFPSTSGRHADGTTAKSRATFDLSPGVVKTGCSASIRSYVGGMSTVRPCLQWLSVLEAVDHRWGNRECTLMNTDQKELVRHVARTSPRLIGDGWVKGTASSVAARSMPAY
jgi:hypothetical protein